MVEKWLQSKLPPTSPWIYFLTLTFSLLSKLKMYSCFNVNKQRNNEMFVTVLAQKDEASDSWSNPLFLTKFYCFLQFDEF